MILLHGRGASPEDILGIGAEVDPGGVIYLAPEARSSAWYPQTFLAPQKANQPWLSSALTRLGEMLEYLEAEGIPPERVILLGFSQGACLASEYAARNPRRYGGIAALSGGVIGADDDLQGYEGRLADTPIFLGCSDVDPHIPVERVHRTTEILSSLGAQVTEQIYPGMGHFVNVEELTAVRAMVEALISDSKS
jgi:predicted esterase